MYIYSGDFNARVRLGGHLFFRSNWRHTALTRFFPEYFFGIYNTLDLTSVSSPSGRRVFVCVTKHAICLFCVCVVGGRRDFVRRKFKVFA